MALTDKLTAIGDAIRSKTETKDLFTLDQMAAKISEMSLGETDITLHAKGLDNEIKEISVTVDAFPCAIIFHGCKYDNGNAPSNARYFSNMWIFPKEDFTKEDIKNYSVLSSGYGRIQPTDSGVSITYANSKITIKTSFTIYSTVDYVWSISPIIVKNQGE